MYILLTVILIIIGTILLLLNPCNWMVDLEAREKAKERRKWRDGLPPLVRNMINPPEGVAPHPPESDALYACVNECAAVAAHEDGKSLVVCSPDDCWDEYCMPAMNIARVYDALFGLSDPKSKTSNSSTHTLNPRIIGRLQNIRQGVRLVRPNIGPLVNLTLPALNFETAPDPSWMILPHGKESYLVSLLQSWSLQTLNAIGFCHSRSVYLTNFSDQQVWIQSDFTAGLTGFVAATIPAGKWMYSNFADNQRRQTFGWDRTARKWVSLRGHPDNTRMGHDTCGFEYELCRLPNQYLELEEGQESEWYLAPVLSDRLEWIHSLTLHWNQLRRYDDPNYHES